MDAGQKLTLSPMPHNNPVKWLIILPHSTEDNKAQGVSGLPRITSAICERAVRVQSPHPVPPYYTTSLRNSTSDYFMVAQQLKLFRHYICSTPFILNYTPTLCNLVNSFNYPIYSSVTPKF